MSCSRIVRAVHRAGSREEGRGRRSRVAVGLFIILHCKNRIGNCSARLLLLLPQIKRFGSCQQQQQCQQTTVNNLMKKQHKQRKRRRSRGKGKKRSFCLRLQLFCALLFATKSKSFSYDCEILSKKMNYIDNNDWKEGSNILCDPQRDSVCLFCIQQMTINHIFHQFAPLYA